MIGDNPAGQNAKSTLAGCAMDSPHAPRKWHECGLEEKVERLRQEVQEQQRYLPHWIGLAQKAWNLVRRHEHNQFGKVVVPAEEADGGVAGAIRSFDRLA